MRVVILVLMMCGAGCAASRVGGRTTTAMDATAATRYPDTAATTQPGAASPSVSSRDFDALWKALEKSLEARMFRIDRRDYRAGILTTHPLISKQFFEFWRRDTLGADDVAESTLNTMRRTVRIEIAHDETTGVYTAMPHVEIERYSDAGRRLTSAAMYRTAFKRTEARGTPERDRGINLQSRYWYTVGSDERLEAALVESTQKCLIAQ